MTSSISLGKEDGDLKLRKTWDIIEAAEKELLPDKIMLNTHPQRWNDRFGPWVKELVGQNMKNVVKKYFYVGTFFTSLSQCFLLTLNSGNDTVQLTIHLF